jgi:hypothetical protein
MDFKKLDKFGLEILARVDEPIPDYKEMRDLIANNPVAQALERIEDYFGGSVFKPALFDYVRGQINLDTLLEGISGHLVRELKSSENVAPQYLSECVTAPFKNKQAAILASLGTEIYLAGFEENPEQADRTEKLFCDIAYELDGGDITLEEAWKRINDYDLGGDQK